MVCYHPLKAYKSLEVNANGKRPVVFNRAVGFSDLPIDLPCGQCIGCRIRRSKVWALRCVHEASLHERNCFLTLTYSDENLPPGNTLVLKHFQDFMKRLRAKYGEGIRFFHCGEYGEVNNRPHYHALVFNHDFSDKVIWKKAGNGEDLLFRSASLEELWPYGHSSIGVVNYKTAAYCARYVLKKLTGAHAIVYNEHMDEVTGEVFADRLPPYITMSRRPGIGKGWFDKFKSDVYPDDFIVLIDGTKHNVPAFYDKQLPEPELRVVKRGRKAATTRYAANNTPERLKVREVVQEARISKLKREL